MVSAWEANFDGSDVDVDRMLEKAIGSAGLALFCSLLAVTAHRACRSNDTYNR